MAELIYIKMSKYNEPVGIRTVHVLGFYYLVFSFCSYKCKLNHVAFCESSFATGDSLLYAFFNHTGVINVVIATMMITVV